MEDTTSLWKDLPLVLLDSKTTSFGDLPPELATDILSRLPVKTLIQSTSVSKRWYSLIKSPIFISSHLARSISNLYILIAAKSLSERCSHCEIFSDDGTLARHSTPKIPFRTRTGTVRIVGSCNGLICLTDSVDPYSARDVYLFNPSVQKYKKLSAEFSCYADWLEDVYASYAVIGFGFYEPENDYRVVRIIYSGHAILRKLRPRVEVYSLNSAKWRSVRVKIDHLAFGGCSAFAGGCLYWLVARRAHERIEWVMSFDLKDEVINEVEMPKGYDDDCVDDYFPVNIMNWNGSIALCVFKPAGNGSCKSCYYGMKKDDDGVLSWKRQLNLVMEDDPTGMAVGVSRSGKLVIDALDKEKWAVTKISTLNPNEMKSKDLAFDGPYTVDSCFMESLVLLED